MLFNEIRLSKNSKPGKFTNEKGVVRAKFLGLHRQKVFKEDEENK